MIASTSKSTLHFRKSNEYLEVSLEKLEQFKFGCVYVMAFIMTGNLDEK